MKLLVGVAGFIAAGYERRQGVTLSDALRIRSHDHQPVADLTTEHHCRERTDADIDDQPADEQPVLYSARTAQRFQALGVEPFLDAAEAFDHSVQRIHHVFSAQAQNFLPGLLTLTAFYERHNRALVL